jgi:hypothetical protein
VSNEVRVVDLLILDYLDVIAESAVRLAFSVSPDAGRRQSALERVRAAAADAATPEPAPAALDVPRCAKCGRDAANDGVRVFFHVDAYECGGWGSAEQNAPPTDLDGEHLHAHCQRCHYQWKLRPLADSASEVAS